MRDSLGFITIFSATPVRSQILTGQASGFADISKACHTPSLTKANLLATTPRYTVTSNPSFSISTCWITGQCFVHARDGHYRRMR